MLHFTHSDLNNKPLFKYVFKISPKFTIERFNTRFKRIKKIFANISKNKLNDFGRNIIVVVQKTLIKVFEVPTRKVEKRFTCVNNVCNVYMDVSFTLLTMYFKIIFLQVSKCFPLDFQIIHKNLHRFFSCYSRLYP